MTRRHDLRIALLALGLQILFVLPATPRLVLCVGSDGHVAIEAGGCADETPETAGDCSEFGTSTPCSDTVLDGSELRSGASPRGDDLGHAGIRRVDGTRPQVSTRVGRAPSDARAHPVRSARNRILRL